MSSPLKRIRDYLTALPPGALTEDQCDDVEGILSQCWNHLAGGEDGGMDASKLNDRTEKMRWSPPNLTFVIERHGGLVRGSSRAEVQGWTVDLDRKTASYAVAGHRRLGNVSKPLDAVSVANDIGKWIRDDVDDPRLLWLGATAVKVRIAEIIPDDGPKNTVRARRKRMKKALNSVLEPYGWRPRSPTQWIYER